MIFERLDFDEVDWAHLDAFADRIVYQTREWVEFIADTHGAEPVVASLNDGSSARGYFTGLIMRRYGLSILGSPMPGWTTGFMGFNLDPGVSRRDATEALLEFAFGDLGCAHLELKDPHLELADVEGLGFQYTAWRGLELDLSPTEEEIFASFNGRNRTAVRKAERSGVVIEEAEDEGFVDDIYPQIEDVFLKQGLAPPYGPDRIREMIRHVQPSGRLLMLRARDSEGTCIATGIYALMNRTMHWVAGGSWRSYQRQNPNEALMWAAMKLGKERGVEAFDIGGFMDYKRKWGGRELTPPHLRKSRSLPVATLRNLAQRAFSARQKLRVGLRSRLGRGGQS